MEKEISKISIRFILDDDNPSNSETKQLHLEHSQWESFFFIILFVFLFVFVSVAKIGLHFTTLKPGIVECPSYSLLVCLQL